MLKSQTIYQSTRITKYINRIYYNYYSISAKMMRTNSRLPPIQEEYQNRTNFILSIQSKKKPYITSNQKSMLEEYDSSETQQSEEKKYFPVQQYKDFLKGQRIYLEVYFKNNVFNSGYQPYIQAMGGEVMKRITSSTTVVLTNQMSEENYKKLKQRIQKTCNPNILILSMLWIEEIYRQKKKVNKKDFLFDEKTDIIDARTESSDQSDQVPDYFYKDVIKHDSMQVFHQNAMKYANHTVVSFIDPRKAKDLKAEPLIMRFDAMKLQIYDNEEQEQKYKDKYTRLDFKSFYQSEKKRKKKQKAKKPNQNQKKRATVRISENRRNKKSIHIRQIIKKKSQKTYGSDSDSENSQKEKEQKEQKQVKNQTQSQFKMRIKNTYDNQESLNTILNKFLPRKQDNEVNKTGDKMIELKDKNKSKSISISNKDEKKVKKYQDQVFEQFPQIKNRMTQNASDQDVEVNYQDDYDYNENEQRSVYYEPVHVNNESSEDQQYLGKNQQVQRGINKYQNDEVQNIDNSNMRNKCENNQQKRFNTDQKLIKGKGNQIKNQDSSYFSKTKTVQKNNNKDNNQKIKEDHFSSNNQQNQENQQNQYDHIAEKQYGNRDKEENVFDQKNHIQEKQKLKEQIRKQFTGFLKEIKYRFDDNQISKQVFGSQTSNQLTNQKNNIIINVVVKNMRNQSNSKNKIMTDLIAQANVKIKQKIPQQMLICFNAIELPLLDKKLNSYPLAMILINREQFLKQILYCQKQKKTLFLKKLNQNLDFNEISLISQLLPSAIKQVILERGFNDTVQLYYICDPQYQQDVLFAALSPILRSNILSFSVLKKVYQYLPASSKKINNSNNAINENINYFNLNNSQNNNSNNSLNSKSNSLSNHNKNINNSQSVSNNMFRNDDSISINTQKSSKNNIFKNYELKQQKLPSNNEAKQQIKQKPSMQQISLVLRKRIFPQFRVETQEIIKNCNSLKGKRIVCDLSDLLITSNVEYITKRGGGIFISRYKYMITNNVEVDIKVQIQNDKDEGKRSFCKSNQKVSQVSYSMFLNSLVKNLHQKCHQN